MDGDDTDVSSLLVQEWAVRWGELIGWAPTGRLSRKAPVFLMSR